MAVMTLSSPSPAANSFSGASSTSISTSLAPLPCSRRATPAPIPRAPPVMRATLPFTEPMAATYRRGDHTSTVKRLDWIGRIVTHGGHLDDLIAGPQRIGPSGSARQHLWRFQPKGLRPSFGSDTATSGTATPRPFQVEVAN